MSDIPEYVRDLLKRIATSEGFDNYTTIVEAGSNHGDGFIGVLARVTLSGNRNIDGNYQEDELKLLCKFGSEIAERRKQFHTDALFKREIYVYEKLFPAFRKFQKSKGLSDADAFVSYPKYYAGVADEENGHFVIIMEDLRFQNFAMWPKSQPAPLDHVRLVMEQLGKYHGVSLAMKVQQPRIFKEFAKLDDLFHVICRNGLPLFHAAYDMAMNAVTDEEHKKILEDLKEHTVEIMIDCVDVERSEPFCVVSHGDCWNNNLLYRYENGVNKDAASVCLIDWQVARYCTPVLDLLYYIFTSTDQRLREKEYDNLLRVYHSALTKIVKKLGSDPQKLFSYEDLLDQLRKFGKFSMLMSPVLISVMMADAKDISNMDDFSQDMNCDKQVSLVKGFDAKTQILFDERIQGLLNDVDKLNLYWD